MDRGGGNRQRMRKSWEWISLSISSFSLHFLFISSFSLHFLFISSFSLHFLAARLQGCHNLCNPVCLYLSLYLYFRPNSDSFQLSENTWFLGVPEAWGQRSSSSMNSGKIVADGWTGQDGNRRLYKRSADLKIFEIVDALIKSSYISCQSCKFINWMGSGKKLTNWIASEEKTYWHLRLWLGIVFEIVDALDLLPQLWSSKLKIFKLNGQW